MVNESDVIEILRKFKSQKSTVINSIVVVIVKEVDDYWKTIIE